MSSANLSLNHQNEILEIHHQDKIAAARQKVIKILKLQPNNSLNILINNFDKS